MKTKHAALLVAAPCLLGLAWVELAPHHVSTVAAGDTTSRGTILAPAAPKYREARQQRSSRGAIQACGILPDGRWLGEDPAEAARTADLMESGMLRDRLLVQTTLKWASNSPQEAKAWAGRRVDPDERKRLLQAIEDAENGDDRLAETARPVVDQLAQAVSLFDGDDTRRAEMECLAERWAGEDLNAAREWTLGQPEGEIRDDLVHRIAMVQVADDPAEAARLVAEEIPAGPQQDEAVMSVVNRWAIQDSVAVAEWVNAFPDGPLKSRALQELRGLAAYQVGMTAASTAR